MIAGWAPEDEGVREAVLDQADGLPTLGADEAGSLRSLHDGPQYPTPFISRLSRPLTANLTAKATDASGRPTSQWTKTLAIPTLRTPMDAGERHFC